jgi:hypothetical protein
MIDCQSKFIVDNCTVIILENTHWILRIRTVMYHITHNLPQIVLKYI